MRHSVYLYSLDEFNYLLSMTEFSIDTYEDINNTFNKFKDSSSITVSRKNIQTIQRFKQKTL